MVGDALLFCRVAKGTGILNVSLHSHHYIHMEASVTVRSEPLVAMTVVANAGIMVCTKLGNFRATGGSIWVIKVEWIVNLSKYFFC